MNRKLLSFFAGAALAVFTAGFAFAGGIPLIPSTSQWSEPSQIINTLNTFIRMLNGQATDMNDAPGNLSIGKFCAGSSATTAVTCSGSRGILTLSNASTLATGAVTNFVLTNTSVNASSACVFQVLTGGAAGSGPTIAQAVPTANTVTFRLVNAGTTATGAAATFTIGFQCFQ